MNHSAFHYSDPPASLLLNRRSDIAESVRVGEGASFIIRSAIPAVGSGYSKCQEKEFPCEN
jgi:hypothetical protein